MKNSGAPGRFFAARLTALNFGLQFVWGAILGVSLPLRATEIGGADALAGYALTAAAGASLAALTQVLCGIASDRRYARVGHRREFYLAGVAGAVPCLWLFYAARTPSELGCAFFGLQIAMNIVGGPYQAAIVDGVTVDRRATAAAWMSALQSTGAAAGLLAAGFIADASRVGATLTCGLLVSFGVTYAALFSPRASGMRAGDASDADDASAAAPPARETRLFTRALGTLGISRALVNLGFYTLLGFLAFYVRESLGVGEAAAQRTTTAILFLIFTGCAALGGLAGARPAARRDPRAIIRATSLLIAGTLIGLACARTVPAAGVAAAIAGLAWGMFVTADWALACAVLPQGMLGTAMGMWNLAGVGPQIVAPLLAAPLIFYGDAQARGFGPRLTMLYAALAYLCGGMLIYAVPVAKSSVRP